VSAPADDYLGATRSGRVVGEHHGQYGRRPRGTQGRRDATGTTRHRLASLCDFAMNVGSSG